MRPACGKRAPQVLLKRLNAAAQSTGRRRWPTARTFALSKAAYTGPSPVDRGRTGSKAPPADRHNRHRLAVTLTGGHRNDVTQLLPLIDGVGPVRGKPGAGDRRRRPCAGQAGRRPAERLIADRGYDHGPYRRELSRRGMKPVIARRVTEHGSGLGKLRCVVERTFAWLALLPALQAAMGASPELHEVARADGECPTRLCRFSSTATSYIKAGSPWQNPYVESFGARIRDELLSQELFETLAEGQVLIEDWRTDYNTNRPQSALGMMAPAHFAAGRRRNGSLNPRLSLEVDR